MTMFRWDLVWHFLFQDPNFYFLRAAWLTLWVSVVAQAAGVILGLFLALMRMSRFRFLSAPAGAYIWFFRGSPLLVQVLLLWDGLPRLFPGLLLSAYACVLVAFSLNEGAYMAEIIRAGITSVDPGQMEAAKSLGMRYTLAMRRIILPQAARVIVPPLGNEFNNMLKTTSIASVIGLLELTGSAEVYGSQDFIIFELLVVATFYYLFLTTMWGYFQSWIENRLNPDRAMKTELVEKKGWAERTFGLGSSGRAGGTLASGR
jgi:polar amino acid transport system permease protein